MNSNQIIDTLSKGIDMLAKKLSVPANKLYGVLMQQVKFDVYKSILDIIMCIIFLCITWFISKKFIKSVKTENGYFYDSIHDSCSTGFATYSVGAILVIAAIVLVTSIFMDMQNILQIKVSPSYYMFKNYIQPLLR